MTNFEIIENCFELYFEMIFGFEKRLFFTLNSFELLWGYNTLDEFEIFASPTTEINKSALC